MSEGWTIIFAISVMLAAVGGAAVLTWFERRLLGLWQDRYGPNRLGPFGIGQVVSDMVKLLTKHDWVPPFADKWVFIFAPTAIVVAMLPRLCGGAVCPWPAYCGCKYRLAILPRYDLACGLQRVAGWPGFQQ